MSIIQTIRDKGTAIVIGVIALSLIGFLLMDASGPGSRNNLFGSNSTDIGSINGEDIEVEDYSTRIKAAESNPNYREMKGQLMQQIWDQMVTEKLIEKELEKLGLVFTVKEFNTYLLSDDAPQVVKQSFTDPETQQFDVEKARQWWQQVRQKKDPEQREMVSNQVIQPMRQMSLYSKYTSLIAASVYTPTWLVQTEEAEAKNFASISFVAIPYSVISDSAVKVTDSEIEEYVSKHKKLYKQEGGRMISYVQFNGAANAQDSARTIAALEDLKVKFAADSNAKAFIARNVSSVKSADAYALKTAVEGPLKDSIVKLNVGSIVGPYLDGKSFVIAKLVSVKVLPDSIKCRHILLGTVDPQSNSPIMADSTAKKKADSVSAAIAGGADFEALEGMYSTDKASHKTKGEMTFDLASIQGPDFAPEFAEFLLNDKGETKKVVKTSFGWHYIEILNKNNPQPTYKVAYLGKEIIPSQETVDAASIAATKLAGEARDEKAFDEYIKKNGLTKLTTPNLTKENDHNLNNVQNARTIIKWAFSADRGEVSEPIPVGEQFIVAVVSKIVKEGLPDAATARPLVESLILADKKAKEIIKNLGNPATLEAAAAKYTKPVLEAGADSTLTFSASMVNGIGDEPKVVGAAFNKDYTTKVSPPIQGKTGVFVIKVNNIGQKTIDSLALTQQIQSRVMQSKQTAMYQSFDALKKMATIKDRRSRVF